jgi:ATP synthase protein I
LTPKEAVIYTPRSRIFRFLDGFAMSAGSSGKDPAHGPGDGEISLKDRELIRRRSSEIGKKLDAVNARRAETTGKSGTSREGAFGLAFKYMAELVVGVVAGVILGGFLDRQFGTSPWLLVLFLMFGFAAGLLNLVRAAQRAQAKNEAMQRSAPDATDKDDDD